LTLPWVSAVEALAVAVGDRIGRVGQRLVHQAIELRVVEGGPPLGRGPLAARIACQALIGLEVGEGDRGIDRGMRYGGATAEEQDQGQRGRRGFKGGRDSCVYTDRGWHREVLRTQKGEPYCTVLF